MVKILKLAAILAGILIALYLGIAIAVSFLFTGQIKDGLVHQLSSQLKTQVTTRDASIGFKDWLVLKPTVRLQQLVISSPSGFPEEPPLLDAPSVVIQFQLLPLIQKKLLVNAFRLDQPKVSVIQAKDKTNLAVLLSQLQQNDVAPASPGSMDEAGWTVFIDQFECRSAQIRYLSSELEPLTTIENLDLALKNLSAVSATEAWASATLFGSPNSRFQFSGTLGPPASDSMPAQGKLSMALALAEIPKERRTKYFGDLLRETKPGSQILLELELAGDLHKTLSGQGQVQLVDLQMGHTVEKLLPLNGTLPISLQLERFLVEPSYALSVSGGSLQLATGKWNGSIDLRFARKVLSGTSRGTISDVDINDLLSAFTASTEKIYGKLTLPEYIVEFSGSDATTLRQNLKASGTLKLEQGRLAFLDLLQTIDGHARKLLGQQEAASGETPFANLGAQFRVADQVLYLTNVALESPQLVAKGSGQIDFDHNLNLALDVQIRGAIAQGILQLLSPSLAASTQNPTLTVPLQILGSFEQPRVRVDFRKLVRRTVEEKAKELFRSLFNQ